MDKSVFVKVTRQYSIWCLAKGRAEFTGTGQHGIGGRR